ncbi:hypothetical protein ASG90_03970 [Nocardioides sp. Soil797]|nr:hypothetical protein ASG90_03970 [Nocardioides sp. Soil797]
MKIRNRSIAGGLAAGALAVTSVMAMSTSAQAAADDYTPNGGPEAAFIGSNVSFTATEAGQTLTCTQFDLSGTVTDPGTSRAFGDEAGSLGDLQSSGCTNPVAGATTVDPIGVWGVTITGAEVGSVSPAQLTDVNAFVEAAGCSFNVGGTVNGEYDDSTGVFTPGGSGLTISDVPVGFLCSILGVAQGQSIEVNGTWQNVPPAGSTAMTITNP